MSNLLYHSPILMVLGYLVSCAIASVSILYFCRPSRGPGYWTACCCLLVFTYALFAMEHFAETPIGLGWLVNGLLVLSQAVMILGIVRFMQRPLPFWILPASVLPMLLANLWQLRGAAPQAALDAVYSAVIIGLALVPLRGMRDTDGPQDDPAIRNFIVGALLAYALAHLLRLMLAIYLLQRGDNAAFFRNDSVATLALYSGLPFLAIALVALTAMSLHRTLGESRRLAELAEAHLQRFEQLMRVSSAAMLLVREGRIADSNPKLGELFGCRPEALHGRAFAELFHSDGGHRLEMGSEQPQNLVARRADGGTFQAEIHLKRLDDRLQLAEIRDVSRQKSLEAQLARLADTDPLTATLNRRAFGERYPQELGRARRQGTALTLALLDLDHFKRINDQHGHAVGDEVLVAFTRVCRQQARGHDLLARLGGEEFVLLLQDCNAEQATALLVRIREQLVRSLPPDTPPIGFSAGLADALLHDTLDATLLAADKALYQAKHNGRNRTEVAR